MYLTHVMAVRLCTSMLAIFAKWQCQVQVAMRLSAQQMDVKGGEDVVAVPGDYVLDRRLRTASLTKLGMAHAWRWLRTLLTKPEFAPCHTRLILSEPLSPICTF